MVIVIVGEAVMCFSNTTPAQSGAQCVGRRGPSPLLPASKDGSLDVVLFLLDPDMNARVHDETGNTPLHLLTTNGGLEVI